MKWDLGKRWDCMHSIERQQQKLSKLGVHSVLIMVAENPRKGIGKGTGDPTFRPATFRPATFRPVKVHWPESRAFQASKVKTFYFLSEIFLRNYREL